MRISTQHDILYGFIGFGNSKLYTPANRTSCEFYQRCLHQNQAGSEIQTILMNPGGPGRRLLPVL